ncbi:MAG: type II toxin-antitoxin system death-on-curing family toxin [Acidimicrobiales bacterium]
MRSPDLCRLVDSALHSPQATFDGVDLIPTIQEKAATLCRHMCLNHPFPDGNKRMAWIVTVLFLELNGFEFPPDDIRAICVLVEIASSNTNNDEIAAAFARWIRRRGAVAA